MLSYVGIVTHVSEERLAKVFVSDFPVEQLLDQRLVRPCDCVAVGMWLRMSLSNNHVGRYEIIAPPPKQTNIDSSGRISVYTEVVFAPDNSHVNNLHYCWSPTVGIVEYGTIFKGPWRPNSCYAAWIRREAVEEEVDGVCPWKWILPDQALWTLCEAMMHEVVPYAPWNRSKAFFPRIMNDQVPNTAMEGVVVRRSTPAGGFLIYTENFGLVGCPDNDNKGRAIKLGDFVRFRANPYIKKSCYYVTPNCAVSYGTYSVSSLGCCKQIEESLNSLRVRWSLRIPPEFFDPKEPCFWLPRIGRVIDPKRRICTKMLTYDVDMWIVWQLANPGVWTIDEIVGIERSSVAHFDEVIRRERDEVIIGATGVIGAVKDDQLAYVFSRGLHLDVEVRLREMVPRVGAWVKFSAIRRNDSCRFKATQMTLLSGPELALMPAIGSSKKLEMTVVLRDEGQYVGKFARYFCEFCGFIIDTLRRGPKSRGSPENPRYYKAEIVCCSLRSGCRFEVSRHASFVLLDPRDGPRAMRDSSFLRELSTGFAQQSEQRRSTPSDQNRRGSDKSDESSTSSSASSPSSSSTGLSAEKVSSLVNYIERTILNEKVKNAMQQSAPDDFDVVEGFLEQNSNDEQRTSFGS